MSDCRHFVFIIINSLLMASLLGHMPSLWITHKKNGLKPTTRAQCGLECILYKNHQNIFIIIIIVVKCRYLGGISEYRLPMSDVLKHEWYVCFRSI
jgi:hypothetical protein